MNWGLVSIWDVRDTADGLEFRSKAISIHGLSPITLDLRLRSYQPRPNKYLQAGDDAILPTTPAVPSDPKDASQNSTSIDSSNRGNTGWQLLCYVRLGLGLPPP
jgi:hypothetical protein